MQASQYRFDAQHQAPADLMPGKLIRRSHGRQWWIRNPFRCESILLRSRWVMLVMDVFTRRIVGFGVESAGIVLLLTRLLRSRERLEY
jgi:hypothetical protein